MSTELIYKTISTSSENTEKLGEILAGLVSLPLTIELRADLGGGKTTLVKGLVRGLKSDSTVTSPTFTLSRVYKVSDDREVHHYDFYRLPEPGILKEQIAESVNDKNALTIVEWSDIVADVLPKNRIIIELNSRPLNSDEREVVIRTVESNQQIIRELEAKWENS